MQFLVSIHFSATKTNKIAQLLPVKTRYSLYSYCCSTDFQRHDFYGRWTSWWSM